jgi:hypothetical protein
MHDQAVEHELHFYQTRAGVRRAVGREQLVRLGGDASYALHRVSLPYVMPSTRLFVQRLGGQYRAACGETLVVTGATRAATRQPRNASDQSVHPTGIAVDLRRPSNGKCLRWLRSTLLSLENIGAIEAIEERRPPHFHVAVYPAPYRAYVASQRDRPESTTYRVRRGDTLWGIAARHRTTVDRLMSANELGGARIVPGQTLVIPRGS